MSVWQPHKPYKAPAHERQRKLHVPKVARMHFCSICNKPIHGGQLCESCSDFIKRKKIQEGNPEG